MESLSLSAIKFAGRNLCNNLLSPEAEIYKIISRLLKNFPSSSSYQEVFGPGEAASRGHEIGGSHAENDFGPCEMEPVAGIWWRAPFYSHRHQEVGGFIVSKCFRHKAAVHADTGLNSSCEGLLSPLPCWRHIGIPPASCTRETILAVGASPHLNLNEIRDQ